MADHLRRGMIQEEVRFLAVDTTALTEKARVIHKAAPTAIAALGRALAGALLLAGLLKAGERLVIHILSRGPLKEIYAEANAQGEARGYLRRPRIHLPSSGGKLDVGGAVGTDGTLTVMKDLHLKEPYRSTVPLVSGEIAEDLAHYLLTSEQQPSAVALGVHVAPSGRVDAAGGILLQAMPWATEETLSRLEERLRQAPPFTHMLRAKQSLEDVIAKLLQDFPYVVWQHQPVHYACPCSVERAERALIALGPAELADLIAKKEAVEIVCDFCKKKYRFEPAEVQRLLDSLQAADSPPA